MDRIKQARGFLTWQIHLQLILILLNQAGAAENTWGISLNSNLDALDAIFSGTGTAISLNIDGGDIASAVVINKSPTVTLTGDVTGSAL